MQNFVLCLFCGTQVKYPKENASFYRNHLVALHNVDHRFPGMSIIVNHTIQQQLRKNQTSSKISVTMSRIQNVTKSKTQKVKQKNIIHKKNQYELELQSSLLNKRSIESNKEDAMLHEAALGKSILIFIFVSFKF